MPSTAIRLIALDLDDTLLDGELRVSRANREAISFALSRGVKVVLASGRNIFSMKRYAEELGLGGPDGLIICTNGAEIVRTATGECLYRNALSPGLCRDAVAAVEEFGLPWQVYEEGRIFVSKRNDWTDLDSKLTGQPNTLITDPEPFFRRGQLKFVCPGLPGSVSDAVLALKNRFPGQISVFTSKPYFLEILDIKSDKGLALERLAAILEIPREAVMAIGDAMNDVGMVRWAGLGCAVGNAINEVKAAAKLVADRRHDQDAVAWLIEKALK
jgi:Cof subfamily protein (haloacid dehalogenase superfamily)